MTDTCVFLSNVHYQANLKADHQNQKPLITIYILAHKCFTHILLKKNVIVTESDVLQAYCMKSKQNVIYKLLPCKGYMKK